MNKKLDAQQQVTSALHSLTSAHAPEGMEARLQRNLRTLQADAEARQRASRRTARLCWSGATAASLVALSLFLRIDTKPVAPAALQAGDDASVERVTVATSTASRALPARQASVRLPMTSGNAIHAPQKLAKEAPPLPLSSQEKMLLAVARSLSLAAGVAVSEPVVDHGLGENALFELDHEPLPAPPESSLETDPFPVSLPTSKNFPGEDQ